jgi:uncharacterized integral membrane protein
MKAKMIVVLVALLLALIILVQNTQAVTFRLFFWSAEISQLLLVLVTLVLGFVLGFLVAKLTGRKKAPQA